MRVSRCTNEIQKGIQIMLTRYVIVRGSLYSVEWLNTLQVQAWQAMGAVVKEYTQG